MMLISNDIMRYAEESDDGNIQNIDVNAMENTPTNTSRSRSSTSSRPRR